MTDAHDAPEAGSRIKGAGPANSRQDMMRRMLIAVGVLLFCLAICLARLDRSFGLFVDDAWYVLLAKTLATGGRYQLINSPTAGILPLYPPAFPAVLSLIYRLAPDFPGNIPALKLVSIASMMGVGLLTWIWLRRYRRVSPLVALGIAVLSALSPQLVSMATSSLMSECFFTFLMMGQIVAAERLLRQEKRRGLMALVCGLLGGLVFLTRSMGIGLIVATAICLLINRLSRQAVIYIALIVLIVGPWMVWTAQRQPTPAQRAEQAGNIVLPYSEQFWQRIAGLRSSGTVTVADLPGRASGNLWSVASEDMLRIIAPPIFSAFEGKPEEAGLNPNPIRAALSLVISLLALIGFVRAARERLGLVEITVPLMFGIVFLWPFPTIRFVLPLTPFLFYYFLRGLLAIIERVRRTAETAGETLGGRLSAGAVGVLLALSLYVHSVYLYGAYLTTSQAGSSLGMPSWQMAYEDLEGMAGWISRSIPAGDTLASNNPALINLFTGHHTVGHELNAERWDYYRKINIRYIVLCSYLDNRVPPALRGYPIVYKASNEVGFKVIDLGPVDSRPGWGE